MAVKELMHDPIFLAQPSLPANEQDMQVAQDLLDTLAFHRECCVGMASNMIGVCKNIIAFDHEGSLMVMFNPKILKASEPYDAQESCLSLLGGPRPAKRFGKIKMEYETLQMQTRIKTFTGLSAQIIQHEIDHCKGILI